MKMLIFPSNVFVWYMGIIQMKNLKMIWIFYLENTVVWVKKVSLLKA